MERKFDMLYINFSTYDSSRTHATRKRGKAMLMPGGTKFAW